jgi:hypothetical protein
LFRLNFWEEEEEQVELQWPVWLLSDAFVELGDCHQVHSSLALVFVMMQKDP